jgi:hypothetical protein
MGQILEKDFDEILFYNALDSSLALFLYLWRANKNYSSVNGRQQLL